MALMTLRGRRGTAVTPIKASVKNGQIIADAPADWPEGAECIIEQLTESTSIGMREEDWPTTLEGIEELIRKWDALEPIEMTPEEEAAWKADLAAQKELEKTNFYKWSEKLRRMWD